MRRFWLALAGVAAVAAILIGVNMAADVRLARAQLDLTEGHLYTLSPGTRAVLAGLKDPVTLRLYWSPALGARLPAYAAYHDRVREMLREYARLSGGKVRVEFVEPEPYSDAEDRAVALGLQGVPLDASGEEVWFGIAGSNLLDDERRIAFLRPERERFLEYDLTRLVHELSDPRKPVLGVMTSLPLDGDPRAMMMARGRGGAGQPWAAMLQLRESFTVKTLPLDAQAIPPDVQVLLVAHAQKLSDAALYAIDQFVMRGGRLMAMVDPASEAEAQAAGAGGMPPEDTSSNLARLFDAWGIAYDPGQVVGDLHGAWRVRSNDPLRPQAVDYVPWFTVRDEGISGADPATAELHAVTVASAGALAKKEGAAIEFTPLLTSSDEAALVPVARVGPDADPAKLLAEFHPAGGPRVLAARVRGVLRSAFTGPPDLPEGVKRAADLPPYKAQTEGPANLVVVADSDILADRFWVRVQDFFGQQEETPFADNGAFVVNLAGSLAGGEALLGLHPRAESLRPFTLVDDMRRRAEARFRQTEERLQAHLEETQKRLASLRSEAPGGEAGAAAAVITPEQRQAIEELRHDVAATRRQLREVQRDLRRDIDRLDVTLQVANVVAVPALVALGAIGLGLARRRRRRRAQAVLRAVPPHAAGAAA